MPQQSAVGLILVNPKVLLMNAGAGLVIGTAGLGVPGGWLAVAFYTVIAGSTVLIPILAYAIAGERVDHRLERREAVDGTSACRADGRLSGGRRFVVGVHGDSRRLSYRRGCPVIALAITSRWISLVPSKIVKIFASRCMRSTG